MSRVLMCSLQVGAGASKGHVHPLLGVAERLVELGHEVVWTSVPHPLADDDRAAIIATGARVRSQTDAGARPTAEQLSRATLDPQRAWEVYRGFLLDPLDALVPRLVDLIHTERPDVIAADSLAYAAFIAARIARVPCVTLCAGLKLAGPSSLATGYRFDLSALEAPRREAFARHETAARFHMLEYLSDALVVVFSTRELVGDAIVHPGVLLAGPSRHRASALAPFPWERLERGRPLVVMAFGSVHTHEPLLDVVDPFVRAATARGADVAIASRALAELGYAEAIVVPYAPQRRLLERATAFITHGGAGSVIESLDAGVPPIVVPLSGDQGLQARLVEERRAGMRLERSEVCDASAAAALDRVMAVDGPLVTGARHIRDAWHGVDGALVAARAIAELAT